VVGWAAISIALQQLALVVTLTSPEWDKEFSYVECTEWLNRPKFEKYHDASNNDVFVFGVMTLPN